MIKSAEPPSSKSDEERTSDVEPATAGPVEDAAKGASGGERKAQNSDIAGAEDVKQLGLIAAIASLSYVFWVVGGMEMIERFAYYGVKAVATLYAKDPVSKGGLGIDLQSFGTILSVWALFQSFVPALTGGLSDRYGYKETIFASTVVKILGYLTMAFFPTFYGFFAGAILLATGTAIFKPGLQGTLVKATKRENSSMAWGIFYQTVNIGGFLGPPLAGFMRKMAWRNVFFACAGIICINFLLLLIYKEPGKAERLDRARLRSEGKLKDENLVKETLRELFKPHVLAYLGVFSGFWFMFNSLFDVLPAHVEDWVDTRDIVSSLFGTGGPSNPITRFLIVMNPGGTEILPEGLMNINSAIIMTTCFLFAALSGKMRAMTSMMIGTLLASLALFLSGYSKLGWISVGAIAIFSVGEMLSSPKFNEYMGNLAPSDKKAMYLGFSQIAIAVGWVVEGKIGPTLYERMASKENFAREMLQQKGMTAAAVEAIPRGEGFQRLVDLTGQDKWDVTHQLYQAHAGTIGLVWYIMGGVGIVSALGIYIYGRWMMSALNKQKA